MTPALLLLAIPGTCLLLTGILLLAAGAERRFLSPPSVVARVLRTRRATPELVEALVASALDPLLPDKPTAIP